MRTTSYILIAAVMLSGTAQARTQAEIDASCAATYAYPGNNLNFVQASNFRRFWISNSLPSSCQNAAYNASVNWTNSAVNVKYIWSGYQTNDAWVVGAGDTISQSAYNTGDTWAQGARFEDPYAWGATMTLDAGANSQPNPPRIAKDGDTIMNVARLSQFHCYTTATPAGLRDMTSHELHELGHAWGLGHDDCDKTVGDANKAVMWWQGFMGTAGEKRTPKARDVARGQYIYGVK